MMDGNRLLRVLMCGVLAFAAVCARSGAAEPYEIYAILPETGSGAFIGKEEGDSLGVVATVVNKSGGIGGRPIAFTVLDDGSNPSTAVQLLNTLIAKKVSVVLGSGLTALCSAMAPLSTADGPVQYCFSPGIHPPKGSYVFSASVSTADLAVAAIRYYRLRGMTRLAILASTDASGQDTVRGLTAALALPENKDVKVVAQEYFNPTDMSVAAQISRIKASDAQALIAWVTGTPVGTILRAVNEAALTIPVFTSSGNETYAQMKAYAAFLPKELDFPGPPCLAPDQLPSGPVKNAVAAYVAAFRAAGIQPDFGQSVAWDPALLTVDALKKLGLNATATQIRDYIAGLRSWNGITGHYDFDAVPQRGVGVDSVVLERWDAAHNTWIGVSRPGGVPL